MSNVRIKKEDKIPLFCQKCYRPLHSSLSRIRLVCAFCDEGRKIIEVIH